MEKVIDTMIEEYKELAAHINRFMGRWGHNVVAIEGGLHVFPKAFSVLCATKTLPVETVHLDNNIHLITNYDGIRYVCILPGEIVPPKDEVA